MKTYRIATIPGDGIGKDVIPAGRGSLAALAAAGEPFAFESFDFDRSGDNDRVHDVMKVVIAFVQADRQREAA